MPSVSPRWNHHAITCVHNQRPYIEERDGLYIAKENTGRMSHNLDFKCQCSSSWIYNETLFIMRSIHCMQIFTRNKQNFCKIVQWFSHSHIGLSQCNWNQCHSAVRGSKGLRRLLCTCLCTMFPQHSVWLVPVLALGTPPIHKMQQLMPDQKDRDTKHRGVTSNASKVWSESKYSVMKQKQQSHSCPKYLMMMRKWIIMASWDVQDIFLLQPVVCWVVTLCNHACR
jgi:hypothetical protein